MRGEDRPHEISIHFTHNGIFLNGKIWIKGSKTAPTLIIVRSNLSKAGHKYFSFVSEEATEYLKDYLEDGLRNGDRLDKESDLISPKIGPKMFIRTPNVSEGIRSAIRGAGLPWRPYVLRSYFDTQLLLAESKGKVSHAYRQFWMGYVGDIESKYTTNKVNLPDTLIEDMRDCFKKSQVFLQMDCTPNLRQVVKQQYLKPPPSRSRQVTCNPKRNEGA
jgi:hypothetical protein